MKGVLFTRSRGHHTSVNSPLSTRESPACARRLSHAVGEGLTFRCSESGAFTRLTVSRGVSHRNRRNPISKHNLSGRGLADG